MGLFGSCRWQLRVSGTSISHRVPSSSDLIALSGLVRFVLNLWFGNATCYNKHSMNGMYQGRSQGGREGALAPPNLPKFFYFIFMCVVVKGGDLIEIVINSA